MNKTLNETIKKLKNFLSSLYGSNLSKVVLFGSQARGEATPNSDIDIMIVVKEYLSPSDYEKFYCFISELCLEYDVLISSIQILEQSYESDNSPLLINVRKEGIVL